MSLGNYPLHLASKAEYLIQSSNVTFANTSTVIELTQSPNAYNSATDSNLTALALARTAILPFQTSRYG